MTVKPFKVALAVVTAILYRCNITLDCPLLTFAAAIVPLEIAMDGFGTLGAKPVNDTVANLKFPEPAVLPETNILTVKIDVVVFPGAGILIFDVVVVVVPVAVTEPFVAVENVGEAP